MHNISIRLYLVARVRNLCSGIELFLQRADVDEPGQQVGAAGLVVCAGGTGTTKGLLADNGAGALAVDVEVAGGVAKLVLCKADGLAVTGEDGARQAVLGRRVDQFAGLAEGIGGGIVVDVRGQDGAEELGRQELVGGVGGLVDGGVHEIALGRVVLAAGDELNLPVRLGLVNGARELLEGGGVDDGTAEVGVVPRLSDRNLLDLGHELLLELGPDGLGDVEAGGGAALLALELKGAADGVLDGIVQVGRWVDQVEVLAASLANDSGVGSVAALGNTLANGTIKLAEDGRASGVVKSSELLVSEDGPGDLFGVTRDELNDVLGQTGLEQDLVDEPVGGNGEVTGLPNHDVAHEGGGTRQVAGNGREVEGAHGVDETLEGAVLETVPQAGRIVFGLLREELLGVVDVEAEEVSQLGGGINLGLPGVLALTENGSGHDLVPVLVGDEIGSFEEDGGTIGERESLPRGLGRQGSINGLVDIGGSGSVVVGDLAGVVRRVELVGEGGGLDLDEVNKSKGQRGMISGSFQRYGDESTYLLATDNNGNLDWGPLLVALDSCRQSLALSTSLCIVVLNAMKTGDRR